MRRVSVRVAGLVVVVMLLATPGLPAAYAQAPRPVVAPTTDVVAAADTVAGADDTRLRFGFTYQGYLEDAGGPLNGVCDFWFVPWDAAEGGSQVASAEAVDNVEVRDGRFTVLLAEGLTSWSEEFEGAARWLAIEVRCPSGSGDYVPLTPRQPLTAVPYAHSLRPGATIGLGADGGASEALRLVSEYNGLLVLTSLGTGVSASSGSGRGLYARTSSSESYGAFIENTASEPSGGTDGVGLFARGSDGDAPDIVLGANGGSGVDDNGVIASSPKTSTSDVLIRSNHDIYMMLDANADETGAFFVRDDQNSTVWTVDENGNTAASGTKSAVVDAGDYGKVKLYAVESPESWFEDFGTATLVAGEATVAIEPVFAETVNLDQSYHVYLTPLGDCPLYVADKAADAFTVRAMGGATCEIDVDYRIVAKRAGYEALRLEPVEAAEVDRE